MEERITNYIAMLSVWDFILKLPREYRKRHLQRLERKIRNQRLQIKIMDEQWHQMMRAYSMQREMTIDLRHKLAGKNHD